MIKCERKIEELCVCNENVLSLTESLKLTKRERIDNIYKSHPPTEEQIIKYNELRTASKELHILMTEHCPESVELQKALSRLQEASMWANAAIARNS